MIVKELIGNRDLLKYQKTAFLCSRKVPASIVLKCYDWAIKQRESGRCVISGFHSQIEKDVLHYLLKGNQPIIIVLARGLKKKIEPIFLDEIKKNRLLIITPFEQNITRVTQETANKRNELMAQLADEIFVAYAQPGGIVERLVMKRLRKGNKVKTFNVPENCTLIDAGIEII